MGEFIYCFLICVYPRSSAVSKISFIKKWAEGSSQAAPRAVGGAGLRRGRERAASPGCMPPRCCLPPWAMQRWMRHGARRPLRCVTPVSARLQGRCHGVTSLWVTTRCAATRGRPDRLRLRPSPRPGGVVTLSASERGFEPRGGQPLPSQAGFEPATDGLRSVALPNELLVVCQAGIEPAPPRCGLGVHPTELLTTAAPTGRTRVAGRPWLIARQSLARRRTIDAVKHTREGSNLHLTDLGSAALPIELRVCVVARS